MSKTLLFLFNNQSFLNFIFIVFVPFRHIQCVLKTSFVDWQDAQWGSKLQLKQVYNISAQYVNMSYRNFAWIQYLTSL